jgi:putative NADPH-quinone reductase
MYDKGYLRGKTALVVATAGSPESDYQPLGTHKATLKQMLYPMLHGTLAACGLSVLDPYLVHNVHSMEPDGLHEAIENYRAFLTRNLESPSYFVTYVS